MLIRQLFCPFLGEHLDVVNIREVRLKHAISEMIFTPCGILELALDPLPMSWAFYSQLVE